MQRIDKLLIKAQRAAKGGLELILAMVVPDGNSWAAVVHLWDGKNGHSPTIQQSTWPTMDAAVEHIHELANEYPNSRDVPIIIDDLG